MVTKIIVVMKINKNAFVPASTKSEKFIISVLSIIANVANSVVVNLNDELKMSVKVNKKIDRIMLIISLFMYLIVFSPFCILIYFFIYLYFR